MKELELTEKRIDTLKRCIELVTNEKSKKDLKDFLYKTEKFYHQALEDLK
ncbi:MAG: hypothetical protein ACO3UU_10370 [Minisyncoccia bacterium]